MDVSFQHILTGVLCVATVAIPAATYYLYHVGSFSPKPLFSPAQLKPGGKIMVIGDLGMGKSTLAQTLANMYDVTFVCMDAINFSFHGFEKDSTPEEFMTELKRQQDMAPKGWITDGNYSSKGTDSILYQASALIWLDYHPIVQVRRLGARSFSRLLVPPTDMWGLKGMQSTRAAECEHLWFVCSHGRAGNYQYANRFYGEKATGVPCKVRFETPRETDEWLDQLGGLQLKTE